MTQSVVHLRDVRHDDVEWIINTNAAHYAQLDGFDATFRRAVEQTVTRFLKNHDPHRERAYIAADGTERLGSVFCVRTDNHDCARLKLFFVKSNARRTGLGQRLLTTCIDFARGTGHRTLVLRTHESHKAACALYLKNGFRLISSAPKRSFGVDVVEQYFERDLT